MAQVARVNLWQNVATFPVRGPPLTTEPQSSRIGPSCQNASATALLPCVTHSVLAQLSPLAAWEIVEKLPTPHADGMLDLPQISGDFVDECLAACVVLLIAFSKEKSRSVVELIFEFFCFICFHQRKQQQHCWLIWIYVFYVLILFIRYNERKV